MHQMRSREEQHCHQHRCKNCGALQVQASKSATVFRILTFIGMVLRSIDHQCVKMPNVHSICICNCEW
jgi:hypothetical protein